jgi:hypothetical protein
MRQGERSILKNKTKAVDSQYNRDQPSDKTDYESAFPIPIKTTEPQGKVSRDTDDDCEQSKNTANEMRREFRWFEVFSLIVNGILAIVGIGALVVYNGQLGVMRGTLAEMKVADKASAKSAYAACVGAQIARSALLESQQSATDEHESSVASTYQALVAAKSQVPIIRPLVKAEPQFGKSEIFLPIDFTNVGKDATTFNAFIDAVFLPVTEKINFSYYKDMPRWDASLLGEGQNASGSLVGQVAGIGVKNSDRSVHRTAPEDVIAYQKGEKAIVFYGKVTYFDIFGIDHWITFCRTFERYPEGSHNSGFPECADYNKQDSTG